MSIFTTPKTDLFVSSADTKKPIGSLGSIPHSNKGKFDCREKKKTYFFI